MLGTEVYRLEITDDVDGIEASAAMKNVYAIALGIADGLAETGGEPWHNLKAATFAQAAIEMQRLATALGGRAETAVGLAGVGDLEVTGLSGRNKVYGARIGRGESAKAALDEMVAAGQTVEGVAAARFAAELAEPAGPRRPAAPGRDYRGARGRRGAGRATSPPPSCRPCRPVREVVPARGCSSGRTPVRRCSSDASSVRTSTAC